MNTVAFWSGGKDAASMLWQLRDSEHEAVALLTTWDESTGLVPHQSIRIEGIRRQAESIGLPVVEAALPHEASNEVYVERVLAALAGVGAEAVAFGDLHLADIRSWRKEMFADTGYRTIFPLWGRSTRKLARKFLRDGFEAVVTAVDTRVLDLEFLGRPFDEEFLDDLPDAVDPCGENGEFHTAVWDGPNFESALQGELGDVLANGPFVAFDTNLVAADSP